MIHTDTIAAIATGMNTAGIGIIRISGDDSFSVVKDIFRTPSGKSLDDIVSHKVYYGYIYDDDELIDEVLIIPMKAPKSYTTEDTVEIDCHGGLVVMNRLLDTVLKHGARAAEPGEFTKRAFLGGRIDLSKAEAVADLIDSKNKYAVANSLKILTGDLYQKLCDIKDKILYEIAYIEAALDDPEHYDLTGYPDSLKIKVYDFINDLNKLIESYKDGRILHEGINTVILGKPNAGKSSILNTLLGTDRAIVTDIAGTTRDSISEQITIDGINLNITDTAGIHETDDTVESIGVEKSKKLAEDADLILMVIDSSVPLDNSDMEIINLIKDKQAVILYNKNDLIPMISTDELSVLVYHPIISVSAKDNKGLDSLKKYIRDNYIKGSLKYNDEIFISNKRQLQLLTNSVNSLKEVLNSIDGCMPEDFYSIDLTNAYDDLCRIIGESVSDDVVNEVFSRFCMGK